MKPALSRLEDRGFWEKLEDLSSRFKLPFIPEYELGEFSRLRRPELASSLEEASRELGRRENADAYLEHGRLRRLLGDAVGAARDFKKALDLNPRLALARAWLGELALGDASAEESLSQAIALEPGLSCAYFYRGAGRLLGGRLDEALEDFASHLRLRPEAVLGRVLLGAALERLGRGREAARAFAEAAALNSACAALHWLASGPGLESAERALDADPTYALITLSWHGPGRAWAGHLRRLRTFAFREPERAGWYYRQEDIHYSPYQFEEYEDSLRLSKLRPGKAWALALCGRAILRCPPSLDRSRRGLELLERAAALSPSSGWILAWRALARIKLEDPAGASRDFEACLRLQPFYHRAYAWRGALRRKTGDLKGALGDLDRALFMDEQYAFAWHERSLVRRALGDWAPAARDLDRAFALDFRYSWLFTVGREPSPEERALALEEISQAVAAEPRHPSLLAWRGQLRLEAGDESGAVLDLEKACRLDPQHALAQAWLGRARLGGGSPGPAENALRKAAELAPELSIFRGWLARALAAQGRLAQAQRLLDSLLKDKPETWWAFQEKAELYLEAGRARRALPWIMKSLACEGRHAESHYLEARIRLELGRLPKALAAVEKALTISPNLGRGYLLRARIRERLGRSRETVEDFRKVYAEFPYLFNSEEKRAVAVLLAIP
ncbi:MAG: tetratricopeptide repeat protein [Elusimicrobia bacterium]|nr:tetratricopeptide repeat protein [Elusimicrobiota bacterium]